MTEADKFYMNLVRLAREKQEEHPKPMAWPFPSKLNPLKPLAGLPFNPDNHEEALL